ncbi:hypothetical protein KUCAC02_023882, partial [Chaenocephalus aceratus]
DADTQGLMWPPARWWAFWSTFILPCKAPRWAERARLTVCIRRATALCIWRPSITIKEGGGGGRLEALRSPVPAKVRAGDLLAYFWEAVCGPEILPCPWITASIPDTNNMLPAHEKLLLVI